MDPCLPKLNRKPITPYCRKLPETRLCAAAPCEPEEALLLGLLVARGAYLEEPHSGAGMMATNLPTFNKVQLQKVPPSDYLAQVEKVIAAAPGGSQARRKRLVAKLIGRKVAEPFDQETA